MRKRFKFKDYLWLCLKGNSGLTVIEVLVSMVLLTFVITGLIPILMYPINLLDQGREMVVHNNEIRGIYRLLTNDLANVVNKSLIEPFTFQGDSQNMRFYSRASIESDHLVEVEYSANGASKQQIVRRWRNVSDNHEENSWESMTILSVPNIKFAYFHSVSKVWVSYWDEKGILPTAVRLEFYLEDQEESSPIHFIFSVYSGRIMDVSAFI